MSVSSAEPAVPAAARVAGPVRAVMPAAPPKGWVRPTAAPSAMARAAQGVGRAVPDLLSVGVLAVVTVAFSWPAIAHGLIAYENDTRIFYYPLLVRLSQALKSGVLPLWSPDIFGGYPILADGEAGSLYPLHLLTLLALPVDAAFVWLRPIRVFQAALFTFLFCRAIGLGRFGAVVGAIAFALSGFAVAQMHHQNVSTAAVWLPLVLAFAELALRHSGRTRYAFAILAGVAFGLQGLIIHVQVVLMSALTLGAYCVFRALVGPVGAEPGPFAAALAQPGRWPKMLGSRAGRIGARLGLAAAIVGIAGATGGSLAAVQLLPLYELSAFSFRGVGVDYAFASQYSLPPVQLLSLLLPDFFVVNGQYWGLWSRWEVFAYAGIAPLVLAVTAVVLARHRLVPFFLALGVVSLALALGENSPFGVHRALASLPGFAVLRAPGRFLFLVGLSVAILAGFGADALRRELRYGGQVRLLGAPAGGVARRALFGALLLGLQLSAMAAPLLLALAGAYVETHKDVVVPWLQGTFMRMRGFDGRWTVEHLYQFVAVGLDLLQPTTIKQLALLLAVVGTIALWDRLRTLGGVWQAALLVLVAADLVAVGQHFHPTAPLATFAAPTGVATFLASSPGLYRVFTQKESRDEPNRLLTYGIAEANGYSSLEPDRHLHFTTMAEYAPNRLLDLMNARFYVVRNRYQGQPSFELTAFNPRRPLLSSTGRNPAGEASYSLEGVTADRLRVVSSLRWATNVPQGAQMARLTATDTGGRQHSFTLLAGVHTAEWAWERPDLRGKIGHELPRVAHTWQQQDGRAPPFPAHHYFAEFPLGARVALRRVEVQFLHPTAQIEVYGLAAFDDESKDAEQLDAGKLDKLQRVYADADVILYENRDYLPRAFLVPSAVIERPGVEILTRMGQGDFSPERFVILEEQVDLSRLAPPAASAPPIRFDRPQGTVVTSGPGTVHLLRTDSDHVRLEANAQQNAMLFLADLAYPGWKAYVDGVETPIRRANYIFRAIFVPAGQHTVDFVYQPRSFRLGLLITLAAMIAVLGALVGLAFGAPLLSEARRRWPRRRHSVTMAISGTPPPAAAAVTADEANQEPKGAVSHGRQEPQEHSQAAQAEEERPGGRGGTEEKIGPPSTS